MKSCAVMFSDLPLRISDANEALISGMIMRSRKGLHCGAMLRFSNSSYPLRMYFLKLIIASLNIPESVDSNDCKDIKFIVLMKVK